MTAPALHVAYAVYWGMLEPLGRSVLAPELELLARHLRLTVVTWEKPADLDDRDRMDAEAERWRRLGVRWIPLRYRKHPPAVSSVMDARLGTRTLLDVHRDDPVDLFFGRALVGGLAASEAAAAAGRAMIQHTEGSWVDEQVDAGAWRQGALAHRAARRLEARTLRRADGVIALTEATLATFRRQGRLDVRVPTAVIPNTSVLADRARPEWLRRGPAPERWVVSYLGSVGGRYLLDEMFAFAAHLGAVDRLDRMQVLAPRDHDLIGDRARRAGIAPHLDLRAVPFAEIPEHLAAAHVGLFFLADGIAAPFVSATKVAEYLACGLAVVTTDWAGDAADRVREARAGVVLEGLGAADFAAATDGLADLLTDPGLPLRAQEAARSAYGTRRGVERTLALVSRVLDRNPGGAP